MSLRKHTTRYRRAWQARTRTLIRSAAAALLSAPLLLWPAATSAAESGAAVDTIVQAGYFRVPAPAEASADAGYAFRAIMQTGDNLGLPFVIVDKKTARLFVFEGDGLLRGASPALLGLAPGDSGVTSMAGRPVSSLDINERTTPAGRFLSEPGHNLNGEAIVWFDYAAKLAIHRLRPADPRERRAERLASAATDDNRISLGCVVVPVSFYESVIAPLLGKSHGVVYVLPETQKVQDMFNPGLSAQASIQTAR